MDTSSSSGTTAVVIGGSIAGSLAAAALADYATQVVVVDRDVLPAAPVLRKGAPHAHQVHALTVGGRLAMEELLPGLTKNAVADGVPLIDTAKDIRYATKCGWLPRFDSEMRSLMASRPYIETLLRRHASALDNVTFRDSTEVTGWLLEDDRVVGVETRGPGDQVGQIRAGLVIDTMGRGSATPDWLEVHGYPRPEQTTINARWGYATVYLKPPAGWQPEFRSMFIAPRVAGSGPTATRGAAIWEQEDGVWGATAQGCAGDLPPSDLEGLREYLASIDAREIVELLDTGEVVAPLRVWRNTANRLRDYAGVSRRPEGLVMVGDAVAAFNPIYGMGMAVAALGAGLLKTCLRDAGGLAGDHVPPGFAENFQQRLNSIVQRAWASSTGADRRVPGVRINDVDQPSPVDTPENQYLDRVLALAMEDESVAKLFIEMRQLLRTADWLADPLLRERVTAGWDRLGDVISAAEAK